MEILVQVGPLNFVSNIFRLMTEVLIFSGFKVFETYLTSKSHINTFI